MRRYMYEEESDYLCRTIPTQTNSIFINSFSKYKWRLHDNFIFVFFFIYISNTFVSHKYAKKKLLLYLDNKFKIMEFSKLLTHISVFNNERKTYASLKK